MAINAKSWFHCVPLYLYENADDDEGDAEDSLFAKAKSGAKEADSYTRRDGISDAGLKHFQAAYPTPGEGSTLTKEDLFYYIYGLLHSPDYRSRYADNLGKELPRIPAVKRFAELTPSLSPLGWAAPNASHCLSRTPLCARLKTFSPADRGLALWRLHYETVDPYSGVTHDTGKHTLKGLQPAECRVEKMKVAKTRDPETNKSINDKTTVLYNDYVTIRNIPPEAYAYIVNGKPSLEWVMERQSLTADSFRLAGPPPCSWRCLPRFLHGSEFHRR